MKEYYRINIKGMERDLPLCPLNDKLQIGAFVIFGDVELTVHCARELIKMLPEHDVMITAESKGIPLIHEMARQTGENTYVLARKKPKLYMKNILKSTVHSITTEGEQSLYIDGDDVKRMKGKRVVIVDDVISTGESLSALEQLVGEAGGNIVGQLCILAEGEARDRKDIKYLEYLPLFDSEGNEI
ncbi:MAG: adenine phosphoribosyltransferase [Clostridia bacterium]|nr:adenine phosphoribosyltransferase [Clostridia bacterium]